MKSQITTKTSWSIDQQLKKDCFILIFRSPTGTTDRIFSNCNSIVLDMYPSWLLAGSDKKQEDWYHFVAAYATVRSKSLLGQKSHGVLRA